MEQPSKTICQSCGRIIDHVTIDRQPGETAHGGEPCFFTVDSEGTSVSLQIPNNALCRNLGDMNFIANSIHCPKCYHYPFGYDIKLFDVGTDIGIVDNTVPLDDELAIEEVRMKRCSVCGKEIPWGCEYKIIGDNYIQVNFFDSDKENIFCSDECLLEAISAMTVTNGEEE